jgi:cardiolipin synthase
MVSDAGFAATLAQRFDAAFAVSAEVVGAPAKPGWRGLLQRGLVAWAAALYLRLAGFTGRY